MGVPNAATATAAAQSHRNRANVARVQWTMAWSRSLGGIVALVAALAVAALAAPFVIASVANDLVAAQMLDGIQGRSLPAGRLVAAHSQVANGWSSNMCILFAGVALQPKADFEAFRLHTVGGDISLAWVEGSTIQLFRDGERWTTCDRGYLDRSSPTDSGGVGAGCGRTSVEPGFYELLQRLPDREGPHALLYDSQDRLPGYDLRCN